MDYVRRTTCRSCSFDLTEVLDLGSMPLANNFLTEDKLEAPEYQFPLSLAFCRSCFLAQVPDVVDPELLFKDYLYTTGSSPVLVKHFEELAAKLRPFLSKSTDLAIDIGGNDGTLLAYLKGYPTINVDPALNLRGRNEDKGISFIPHLFSDKLSHEILLTYGKAKVITATNAFAHSDHIEDMAQGVADLLDDEGVFVLEVHWVKNLLEGGYDQIYHEHLCYYSLHSLIELLEPFGLTVFAAKIIPIHGQSLRVFVSKSATFAGASVEAILSEERQRRLTDVNTYLEFGKKVERNKDKLRRGLANLRKQGKRIAGYGAAAKGNILLNYCKIHPHLVEYLVDSSPLKQGLYSPGVHIPVKAPEYLQNDRPDYVLLLAWNYADDILKKEQLVRDLGTKFIIPIPEVSIV